MTSAQTMFVFELSLFNHFGCQENIYLEERCSKNKNSKKYNFHIDTFKTNKRCQIFAL